MELAQLPSTSKVCTGIFAATDRALSARPVARRVDQCAGGGCARRWDRETGRHGEFLAPRETPRQICLFRRFVALISRKERRAPFG
jgi:hypothetical protein